jgi:hypothetical protein
MSFTRWLSSVQRPSGSKTRTRRRHTVNPPSGLQNWLLEDRCLLSRAILPHRDVTDPSQSTIYVANRSGDSILGPYTLQNAAATVQPIQEFSLSAQFSRSWRWE